MVREWNEKREKRKTQGREGGHKKFSSGYRLGVSAYPPGPREVLKEVVAWLLPRYYLHRAYRDVILRTGGLA